MCVLLHAKLRNAVWDARGGLSNINMKWHRPNGHINRGEEGLKQQSSERTAQTGENNLQSPDPRAFTPAQKKTLSLLTPNMWTWEEKQRLKKDTASMRLFCNSADLPKEEFCHAKTSDFCCRAVYHGAAFMMNTDLLHHWNKTKHRVRQRNVVVNSRQRPRQHVGSCSSLVKSTLRALRRWSALCK